MVDPVSDEERATFLRKLKAGFVALVGASAGLITLQGDVGLPVVLAAAAAGVAVGLVLVWFVFPSGDSRDGSERAGWQRNR